MGWFKSLEEELNEDGFGQQTILVESDYNKATNILVNKIGPKSANKLISDLKGIQNVVYFDLVLDKMIHKDIPINETRIEYLKIAQRFPEDDSTPFLYNIGNTIFQYLAGDSFKQFYTFAKKLSKEQTIVNSFDDYELTINPILDNLFLKYGRPKKTTPSDFGGTSREGKILYLPNSSPLIVAKEFINRSKELPKERFYFDFVNFKGNQKTWKEAIQKEELEYK